jgi:hypothetical protein
MDIGYLVTLVALWSTAAALALGCERLRTPGVPS